MSNSELVEVVYVGSRVAGAVVYDPEVNGWFANWEDAGASLSTLQETKEEAIAAVRRYWWKWSAAWVV